MGTACSAFFVGPPRAAPGLIHQAALHDGTQSWKAPLSARYDSTKPGAAARPGGRPSKELRVAVNAEPASGASSPEQNEREPRGAESSSDSPGKSARAFRNSQAPNQSPVFNNSHSPNNFGSLRSPNNFAPARSPNNFNSVGNSHSPNQFGLNTSRDALRNNRRLSLPPIAAGPLRGVGSFTCGLALCGE